LLGRAALPGSKTARCSSVRHWLVMWSLSIIYRSFQQVYLCST